MKFALRIFALAPSSNRGRITVAAFDDDTVSFTVFVDHFEGPQTEAALEKLLVAVDGPMREPTRITPSSPAG
jgi:hypothetical protein